MLKNLKRIPILLLITVVPTLLLWLPFILRLEKFWSIPLPRDGMATIVANYDGPLYIAIAKTLYNKELINSLFNFPLPLEYYAAHFPLYPVLIKPFAGIFGFPYAMLFVTILSSFFAVFIFYKYARTYFKLYDSLWLTLLFSIFPARWLVVRSVGSAEPLFIAAIISSVYYFNKKNYLMAGLFGVLAQLTKPPAILLFIAYFLLISWDKIKKLSTLHLGEWLKKFDYLRLISISLIPLALLGVFIFYQIRMNDFLAYFHSGDNIHLFFPPFQIFNYSAPWVGTFWLEEIIFVYLLSIWGLFLLVRQKRLTESFFVAVYLVSIFFVSHRDIIRYSLPMLPFLILAYSDTIVKREFKLLMLILVIPIYLFSLAYISNNVMPISDWAPLL